MSITINGTTGIAGVDGTASAPSVQGGDSNTGVFFPAADTVAITTGGTERMRVDSSGNVGIGTTSPSGAGTTLATQGAYSSIVAGSTSNANFVSFYSGQTADPNPSILYNNDLRIGSATAPTTAGYAERFRFGSSGQFGVAGANYGTSGQVLTSGGSGAAPSWASRGFASTTITNTSRASGTTFQNTTNGTMLVTVVGANNGATMYAGSTAGGIFQVSRQNATYTAVSCMVPPGWYYRADYSVLNSWIEGQ